MPSERIYAPLNAVEQFVAAMSYSPFWGRFGISSQAFLGAEWWLQDVAKEEEPKAEEAKEEKPKHDTPNFFPRSMLPYMADEDD